MEPLPAELLAFAEDPAAHVTVGPGEERILTDEACLTFVAGDHFWSTCVQRVRFVTGDVDGGLHRIRERMIERGRRAAAWAIGPSATPDDVIDRLLRAGLGAESDEGSAIMVLQAPPTGGNGSLEVGPVLTYTNHHAAIEVTIEGFGWPDHDAADERRRARASFDAERTGDHSLRLLVVDDGRPIATGRVWFSPLGLYLGGVATIPSDRGRGAMGAIVHEAWQEAERRDTPALVTFGGPMAAPALEGLGFRSVGWVQHLIDRIA